MERKPGGGWEGVFISCSTFMRTFTVPASAVTKLEGNVYVFFAGDMGRVALINRRRGKSLSRGLQSSGRNLFSNIPPGLPPCNAVSSLCLQETSASPASCTSAENLWVVMGLLEDWPFLINCSCQANSS